MSFDFAFGISFANELLSAIVRCHALKDFRETAQRVISERLANVKVAWVHQNKAHWQVVGSAGSLATIPMDLVASSSDEMEITRGDGWLAIPVTPRSLPAEVILLSPHNAIDLNEAEGLANLLRSCLTVAECEVGKQERLEKIQTLLDLANQWQRSRSLTELLESIAEAAARVLHGDRASIFLWDRKNSELVGHPAMGIQDIPLRIRDDEGIAGNVLKSGKSTRWDNSGDPKAINAKVGQRVNYTTESLVAAPLLDRNNRPLGVFEVLNHRHGSFSEADEQFLIDLAKQASAAVEKTQRIETLIQSRDRLVQDSSDSTKLIGNCPSIHALRDTVTRVAPTELAVLILGENGTGKEVIARSLHWQSDRRNQPFIAINCAAIAETLLESELFGHEKGAFTDAVSDRAGKFEVASGGTLLLDEIGEMSLGGQAKLLRVLEDKIVTRVGSEKPIRTDVRVIAATNQDLVKMVREKRFREDLYFRLNVITLQLPALRERGEDVVILAEHFLEVFGHQIGRKPPKLSAAARRRLTSHLWPGNVRELRNLMERVAYLTNGDTVEEADLAFVLSPTSSSDVNQVPLNMSLADATNVFQRQYIEQHVQFANGNLAQAAKQLGLHRSNLYRKMSQLGMPH